MKFTADFETSTWQVDKTFVWAFALCEIGNTNNFIYGNNIEDFIKFCSNKKENYKLKEEDFDRIKYYYEKCKDESDVDDITWNDLDMDRIYNRMNTCYSSIGSEYLYAMLRKLKFNNEELKSNNRLAVLFANKKERGIEVWITRLTAILSVAFFVLAICAAFFVERL